MHNWMSVNGLHLYSSFLTSGHSKCFTILTIIHPCMHTPTAESTMPGDSQLIRINRLAQGQLDTQLGGAGDLNSDLLGTSHLVCLLSHPPA